MYLDMGQDATITWGGQILVNGKQIPPAPTADRPGGCRNISIINGKVFVDGYEWKNDEWKRTLRAFWHLWF